MMGSIPVRVIPKTFKMILDTSLLNTQQYKVLIESKVEQSRERSNAIEKGPFWSPSTTVTNFTYYENALEMIFTIKMHWK